MADIEVWMKELTEKLSKRVGTIPRAVKYKDGGYGDFLLMVKALHE